MQACTGPCTKFRTLAEMPEVRSNALVVRGMAATDACVIASALAHHHPYNTYHVVDA